MKHLKKLAGVLLAMVMVMALAAPAFASGANDPNTPQDETVTTPESPEGGNTENEPEEPSAPATNKGSITVSNAAKGETYKLVKLFNASYNNGTKAIVYTGTIPDELKGYFQADTLGYITATEKATGKDGKLSPEAVEAIKDWAGKQAAIEKVATSNTLKFEDLEYGYYVVISQSTNGGAISVDSTTPDATMTDKNPKEPDTPEKVVKDASGKVIQTAQVGETVIYTVTYNTLNWIEREGKDDEKVFQYVVEDTLPDFLSDVTVTSITVTEKGAGAEGANKITEIKDENGDFPQFGEKKQIVIPWTTDGTANGESLYNNGAILTITYTAVVNDKILGTGDANHKNTVTIKVNSDGTGTSDDADLYTATIVIDKFAKDETEDNTDNTRLAGAKFVLKNSEGKYYKWIDATTGADGSSTDSKVEWVSDVKEATEVTTDKNGAASFKGLKEGTYYLEEIDPPAGYNKLSSNIEIKVTATPSTVGDEESGDEDENAQGVVKALSVNISYTAPVENSTGQELPSTGGIGTTLFYVVGGVLVLGAVVLLITKRRTSVDDE